jgi:putative flippase GtrA
VGSAGPRVEGSGPPRRGRARAVISPIELAVRYAVFAAIATATNLAAQWASFGAYDGGHSLAVAIAIGTLVGLVTKYVLDKNWIFYDLERGIAAHGRKFVLYTLMGVATTLLFWGTELLFHSVFADPRMTYVGAAIGLAVGYLTKYQLDRRFVFRKGQA